MSGEKVNLVRYLGAVKILLALGVFVLSGVWSWGQDFFDESLQAFRSSQNLSMPDWDDSLAVSSHLRAEKLAALGALSHEEQGKGPGLQMLAEGFPPGTFGEVLGAGGDPEKVWRAWLDSPSHRALLSDPAWTSWGSGWATRGNTKVFVLRFRGP